MITFISTRKPQDKTICTPNVQIGKLQTVNENIAEPCATILMIIAYQYYMKSALYHDYIDVQAIAAHGFIFLRVKVCLQ